MIRLTRANGKDLYINPQHLIEVGYNEDYAQTLVSTMAEGWYVLESPAEVARKVLEWRLAMEDYLQGTAMVRKQAKEKLFELAGLEEKGNG